MSFTIELPKYEYKRQFNRNEFIRDFPNSMIATALTDQEATEIIITQPFVTPYVIQYLANLIEGVIPPVSEEDMTQASGYLLIPILGVVCQIQHTRSYGRYHPYLDIMDLMT